MEIVAFLLCLGILLLFSHLFTRDKDKNANMNPGEIIKQKGLEELDRLRRDDSRSAKNGRFCILIRSTKADFNLSPYDGRGAQISDVYPEDTPFDEHLRAYLFTRMQPYPLIAVKNSNELTGLASIGYRDEEWKEQVLSDLAAAEFILAIPLWISEGAFWEFQQIAARGWISKTFFVMPPANDLMYSDFFDSPFSGHIHQYWNILKLNRSDFSLSHYAHQLDFKVPRSSISLALQWQRACDRLRPLGYHVGQYKPKGGMLLPALNGSHLDLVPWSEIKGELLALVANSAPGDRILAPPGSTSIPPTVPVEDSLDFDSDTKLSSYYAKAEEELVRFRLHSSRFLLREAAQHSTNMVDADCWNVTSAEERFKTYL